MIDDLKKLFSSPKNAYKYLMFNFKYNQHSAFVELNPKEADIENNLQSWIEGVNQEFKTSGKCDSKKITTNFLKSFGIADFEGKKKFIGDEKSRDFFEKYKLIDQESLVSLVVGSIDMGASDNIKAWSDLEEVISAYKIEVLPDSLSNEQKSKAQQLAKDHQLDSFIVNSTSSFEAAYESVKNGLSELSVVFENKNVGLKKLSLHVGGVLGDFSGYQTVIDDIAKIVFKPSRIQRVIGHEYLHFIDSEMGDVVEGNGYISELKSKRMPYLNKLISGFYEPVENKIEENIKTRTVDTKTNILELVNQFIKHSLPHITEKQFSEVADKMLESSKNKPDEIFKKLVGPLKWPNIKHYIGIIQAEVDLHHDYIAEQKQDLKKVSSLKNKKNQSESDFVSFAKLSSKNMVSISKSADWKGYSESNVEMLARSFEIYLKKVGAKHLTDITPETTLFYPVGEEARNHFDKWKGTILEIKNVLFNKKETNINPEVSEQYTEALIEKIKKNRETIKSGMSI